MSWLRYFFKFPFTEGSISIPYSFLPLCLPSSLLFLFFPFLNFSDICSFLPASRRHLFSMFPASICLSPEPYPASFLGWFCVDTTLVPFLFISRICMGWVVLGKVSLGWGEWVGVFPKACLCVCCLQTLSQQHFIGVWFSFWLAGCGTQSRGLSVNGFYGVWCSSCLLRWIRSKPSLCLPETWSNFIKLSSSPSYIMTPVYRNLLV